MVAWASLCLLALAVAHAVLCPFTKVEESFNMQAMHDVHFHLLRDEAGGAGGADGADGAAFGETGAGGLAAFDHHAFPGVVPRTFLGALTVSAASWPLLQVLKAAAPLVAEQVDDALLSEGYLALLAVRLTLTLLTWLALVRLGASLARRFGASAEPWFHLVCLCQFHIVFYMGRPLPNTFALGLSAFALSRWLDGSWEECVGFLVFTTTVFRCDTLLLTAAVALVVLLRREASFFAIVVDGIATGLSSLLLTVALDSYMWDKPVWPEGSVLFFNTVLNKSAEWGTLPLHWYVSSALPKALLAALPLALLGALQPVARLGLLPPSRFAWPVVLRSVFDRPAVEMLLVPALAYVGLYSLLPHKEVRFLFQVLPFFNALAALGIAKLFHSMRMSKASWRSRLATLGFLLAAAAMLASFALASAFLQVSRRNYPGAEALLALRRHHATSLSLSADSLSTDSLSADSLPADSEAAGAGVLQVHYCVFAAMSGVTRFLEHGAPSLRFSKREDEAFVRALCDVDGDGDVFFDYLVMQVEHFDAKPECAARYSVLETVQGNPRLNFATLAVETDPVLHVLRKIPKPAA